MKNNADTKVSIKFITLLSIVAIMILTIFLMFQNQDSTEVAIEENVEVAKVETTEKKVTSRGTLSTRRGNNKKNQEDEAQTEEQVKQVATEIVNAEPKYISISEVKISKSMDLTKRIGVSKDDFIKLIAGVKADTSGFFEQNAGTIYDLCEQYQINEIFFCGLISAESGWNIAPNHRRTHNYISLMTGGKLIQFASTEAGLEAAAKKLHENYLTPGGKFYYGKTLSGVKKRFCPASSTWVDLVYGRMSQII